MTKWTKALREIHRAFQAAGVFYTLGGSAMLCLRGVTNQARDLDLFVRIEDAAEASRLLCSIGELLPSPKKSEYLTKHYSKYRVLGIDVDLMAEFAVQTSKGIAAFPSSMLEEEPIAADGQNIPCMPLEDWLFLYRAIDRPKRVLEIETHFSKHPANRGRIETLLTLTLPGFVSETLEKQIRE